MLIVTMGDPNGIGPEIICRYFGEQKKENIKILIIGPKEPIDYFCKRYSIKKFYLNVTSFEECKKLGIYLFSEGFENFTFSPGKAKADAGKISGEILKTACKIVKKGLGSAIITCPINKSLLMDAGFKFSGHTEFLANEFGLSKDDICMHLGGDRLKVSLVTTHPPLRKVPDEISEKKIVKCLSLTWDMLAKLKQDNKPIGVCGLNPHAGESGKIGTEEIEIIEPAINIAKNKGIKVEGPYPADTLFYRAYHGEFSAVLAMYHDQGLAPLKLVHFNSAVNVTLGLPVVRTSVDHGTAYELVGKKIASTKSFENALHLAQKLHLNKGK